ncbi:MAG: Do family serine endopeptidase [Candidatus Neomarinimicrobiota bacterium]
MKFTKTLLAITLLIAGSISLLPASASASAEEITVKQINDAFIKAAEGATPPVVSIVSEKVITRGRAHPFFDFWGDAYPERESRGMVLGSGVIINAVEGYVVTNNHVVEDAEDIRVRLYDRREFPGEIVATDPGTDLAVIKISADDLIAAKIGDSDQLRIGEWVLAVGSPFSQSLDHTVTAGIVSGKGRSDVLNFRRDQPYEDFIQTDAAINPGNSGGALVNLEGELVGINTAIATDGMSRSSAGVGFAIPANLVMRVVADLLEHGKVTRAWLGVQIQTLAPAVAKALDVESMNGALVVRVVDDSPADDAGLMEEDIILKVGDTEIRDSGHLRNVISTSRPGERVKLTLIRNGKKKTLTVKLGELEPDDVQASAGDAQDSESAVGRTGFAVAELTSGDATRFRIEAENGVVVTDVDPRSKAARSGVRPGDVVVKVGNHSIDNIRDYRRALEQYDAGDTVLLRLVRGDTVRLVGIELS